MIDIDGRRVLEIHEMVSRVRVLSDAEMEQLAAHLATIKDSPLTWLERATAWLLAHQKSDGIN